MNFWCALNYAKIKYVDIAISVRHVPKPFSSRIFRFTPSIPLTHPLAHPLNHTLTRSYTRAGTTQTDIKVRSNIDVIPNSF